MKVKKIDGDLQIGDVYVGERNTGPKLLTVKEIGSYFIIPEEKEYFYDFDECVKVVIV